MAQLAPPVFPPLDGTVNFPEALDFNLQYNKTRPVYVFSPSGDKQVYISHLEFARACHRVGHIVRPNREGEESEVVSVICLADILVYQTVVLGLMRAGYVVRFLYFALSQ